MAGGPVRQPLQYAGADFIRQSGIYEFGRAMFRPHLLRSGLVVTERLVSEFIDPVFAKTGSINSSMYVSVFRLFQSINEPTLTVVKSCKPILIAQ
jgi:hypothetical protein